MISSWPPPTISTSSPAARAPGHNKCRGQGRHRGDKIRDGLAAGVPDKEAVFRRSAFIESNRSLPLSAGDIDRLR